MAFASLYFVFKFLTLVRHFFQLHLMPCSLSCVRHCLIIHLAKSNLVGEPTDSRPDPIPPPEDGTGTGHNSRRVLPTSSPASTPTHSQATSPTHSRVTTSPLKLPLAGDPPAHSTRVKLPKLSLEKFNGDLTKWIMFWDTFESAVHRNSPFLASTSSTI